MDSELTESSNCWRVYAGAHARSLSEDRPKKVQDVALLSSLVHAASSQASEKTRRAIVFVDQGFSAFGNIPTKSIEECHLETRLGWGLEEVYRILEDVRTPLVLCALGKDQPAVKNGVIRGLRLPKKFDDREWETVFQKLVSEVNYSACFKRFSPLVIENGRGKFQCLDRSSVSHYKNKPKFPTGEEVVPGWAATSLLLMPVAKGSSDKTMEDTQHVSGPSVCFMRQSIAIESTGYEGVLEFAQWMLLLAKSYFPEITQEAVFSSVWLQTSDGIFASEVAKVLKKSNLQVTKKMVIAELILGWQPASSFCSFLAETTAPRLWVDATHWPNLTALVVKNA